MALSVEAELKQALAARDPDRIAALYAEDALLLTPGRPAAKGRHGIARMMAEDFKDPAFNVELTGEATGLSGDIAYTRGTMTVSFTNRATQKTETIPGNFLQIFRQQSDGEWKIIEDISSPAAPQG